MCKTKGVTLTSVLLVLLSAGCNKSESVSSPLFIDPNYYGSCDPEIIYNHPPTGAIRDVGGYFYSTLSGGIGAEISGVNFWEGAATGFAVHTLNHQGHKNSVNQNSPRNASVSRRPLG